MANLPTNVTTERSRDDHINDHNKIHAVINDLDGRAVKVDDSRLSDKRTPLDASVGDAQVSTISQSKIADLQSTLEGLSDSLAGITEAAFGDTSGLVSNDTLNQALAVKADLDTVNAALASKATVTDLINGLSNKINTTAIGAAGATGVANYDDTQTKVNSKVIKGELFLNVEDFRSTTDGSDNAVIQAALAVLQANDGGHLVFPKKLYTVSQTVVVRRNYHFIGASTGTVLKLADDANVDLVQTANFGTLTGGTTQAGPDQFSFSHITFDGNGANQTGTSWTFRCYGSNYKMNAVHFKNGRSGNVWSEWGTGGTNMESQWSDFKIYNSVAGPNVVWNGPHDSSFENGFIFRDGTTTDNAGDGFTTQGNAGGEMLSNVHVWGNHSNGFMLNKLVLCSNCTSEGAYAINVLVNAQRSTFSGTVYGRASSPGSNEVGIQIGLAGGTAITGYVIAASVWQWTASTSIPMNFANDGGGTAMSTIYKTSATSIRGGTISPKSAVTLMCPDDTTQSIVYSPRLALFNASGSAVLITNGVKDMLRFVSNSTDGLMQLPSNTSIRGYSDAYTTERWRIESSTGVFRPGQYATGSRPSASTAGKGAQIFDSTLNKPIWSNGTAWVDATGATV